MNFKERWRVCLEARKAFKRAKKAQRKLRKRQGASWQARNAWKATVARSMRANPTKHEAILSDALTEAGIKFDPQVQVGPYIVDALLEGKHVVEVDGKIHESQKEYDEARDRYLWNRSYRVVRFTNAEVGRNVKQVIDKIRGFMAETWKPKALEKKLSALGWPM